MHVGRNMTMHSGLPAILEDAAILQYNSSALEAVNWRYTTVVRGRYLSWRRLFKAALFLEYEFFYSGGLLQCCIFQFWFHTWLWWLASNASEFHLLQSESLPASSNHSCSQCCPSSSIRSRNTFIGVFPDSKKSWHRLSDEQGDLRVDDVMTMSWVMSPTVRFSWEVDEFCRLCLLWLPKTSSYYILAYFTSCSLTIVIRASQLHSTVPSSQIPAPWLALLYNLLAPVATPGTPSWLPSS